MLTQARLIELYEYTEDGNLVRRENGYGRWKKGQIIGGSDYGKGYLRARVDGVMYPLHHLIWLYHKGYLPSQIDHRDLNKANCRIENLREATSSQNKCNNKVRKDSSTGLKGVLEDKRTGRFRAVITKDGVRTGLGFFATKEEAHTAYCKAADKIHGEFARKE